MCVWQSHAPAGMAKLTAVAGCEGSANVHPARDNALAATAPNTTSRLVVMVILRVECEPCYCLRVARRRNRGHGVERRGRLGAAKQAGARSARLMGWPTSSLTRAGRLWRGRKRRRVVVDDEPLPVS